MNLAEFRETQLENSQKRTLEQFRRLNKTVKPGQIVFTGSSLMEMFPVNELMQSLDLHYCIYNRGISGYVTRQMLDVIDVQILDLAPSKLFINIGTNDIGRGLSSELWPNYELIIKRVQTALPDCRIYVMAYYPCNDKDDFGLTEQEWKTRFATRTPASLLESNAILKEMSVRMGCQYIDVNEGICDESGRMKAEYCMDGVHMYPDGYAVVLKNMIPYLEE